MSELKCSVMPSGNTSFHVWKEGAKTGEPCECGRHLLNVVAPQENGEHGKYDGTTIREVLQWASENVRDLSNFRWIMSGDVNWSLTTKDYQSFTEPTLYEALHKAWEGREK